MDLFIDEKKNLLSEMNCNFNSLLNHIEKINDKNLNDKMVYQFKFILDDIERLNYSIQDLNNNIIKDNFDSNEELDNLIKEQENVNKIINDMMPLYILKSLNIKN